MSVVEKYAKPQITQLSQGVMQQVEAAGKTLAAFGVKQASMQAAQSPAVKYGHPAPSAIQRSPVHGRSH